jgi:hypothetical protein
MAKATITIEQRLQYPPHQAEWFAATQALFNRVAAFYFEVIQAHEGVLNLSNKEALTSRINPRNTSRECARCHAPIIRYAQGQLMEGYTSGAPLVLCPACQMRGHADRNANLVVGQRLITRYQQSTQEKPLTPLATERASKDERESARMGALSRICLPHYEPRRAAATLPCSAARLRKRVRSCRARDARAQCHSC